MQFRLRTPKLLFCEAKFEALRTQHARRPQKESPWLSSTCVLRFGWHFVFSNRWSLRTQQVEVGNKDALEIVLCNTRQIPNYVKLLVVLSIFSRSSVKGTITYHKLANPTDQNSNISTLGCIPYSSWERHAATTSGHKFSQLQVSCTFNFSSSNSSPPRHGNSTASIIKSLPCQQDVCCLRGSWQSRGCDKLENSSLSSIRAASRHKLPMNLLYQDAVAAMPQK